MKHPITVSSWFTKQFCEAAKLVNEQTALDRLDHAKWMASYVPPPESEYDVEYEYMMHGASCECSDCLGDDD